MESRRISTRLQQELTFGA